MTEDRIGWFLFFVASPKAAKARTYSVAIINIFKNIANVSDPLRGLSLQLVLTVQTDGRPDG
jgi:hypothetical protein